MYKIGIDVGGTFTDFLLTKSAGESEVYKVLSTPSDPSIGLLNGLGEMAAERGKNLEEFIKEVKIIVHGTTVTTNAVLTRSGAQTGLLTTIGLRDALEMRRGIREEQYNNRYKNVEPLVPRFLRYPVEERLDYKGDVITAIKESDVLDGMKLFQSEGVEAVAICFMNSFAGKRHEEKAAAIVKEALPDAYLTVSSEFLPSIRFYDRTSTTVLNSYVGPILRRYLKSLIKRLHEIGFEGVLLIMQSNGGVVAPEAAIDNAASTLLSGPAAGPVAGIEYAGFQGYDDCITVDMGGTSFDAALICEKRPLVTTEGEINRLRLALPMLGIHTIGAGGGSIGWVDEGGLLRMGPQSAGSMPGPACYDRGGKLPTCTDADLMLGYLDKDFFAGGRMPLNFENAERAIKEKIAAPLHMDTVEAAAGMYHVININMASGIREVSVKRGYDPREFPLVVAGGAGPIHAGMIALELEIPVMIIPGESSIFCAAGMLMSNLSHSFVRTYSVWLSRIDRKKLRTLFDEMEKEGARLLALEHIPEERRSHVYSLDMRYVKQYHEVNIITGKEEIEGGDLQSVIERFHREHNRLYGYSLEKEGTETELINLRVTSTGSVTKPSFREQEYAGEDPSGACKKARNVYLPRERAFSKIPIFDGDKLKYGNLIAGPAIIEQVHTSIFVPPGHSTICDKFGSFTMFVKEREQSIRERLGIT